MKRLLSIPLRVLLPVLLLTCAAFAGLISWKLDDRLLGGEIESQFLDEARLRVSGLQATVEYLYRKGDVNGVHREVSGIATRNDVIAAYVLSRQDAILAATRYATIGKSAKAIVADLPDDLKGGNAARMAQARASGKGSMVLSQDRRMAVAYCPLLLDVDDHALWPKSNGLMVVVFDLQIAKARGVRATGRQALDNALVFGGLAACAWLFIHFSLTRRVAKLVSITRQFASGNLTARTGIEGSDELADVARAFDLMAERIAMDVLQQRQVEVTLDASRQQMEAMINSVDGIVWEADPLTFQFTFVSQKAEQILGYPVQRWISDATFWQDHVHTEDRTWTFDYCTKATQELRSHEFEYRMIAADGREVWVKDIVTVIGECGRPVKLRGIIVDTTASKRDEAELKNIHKQLLDTSRQAGMAEVATSVLHNVGNVLNSVNVSASLAVEKVRNSKASSLVKVVDLLREHEHDLGAFLTSDSKGRHVPEHLARLSDHLIAERVVIMEELNSLRRNVEHIKEIVSMQQSYAMVAGVKEVTDVIELVEDSLRMNEGGLGRHGVEIVREFSKVPLMNIEKHKILQILVNLLRNAKHACQDSNRADKRLTVRVASDDGRVKITVTDNGVGIAAENLTRIYHYGFTTRKDGHGFGLHSGALAAKEMGGALTVHSDGPGNGATFTLELPLNPGGHIHDLQNT